MAGSTKGVKMALRAVSDKVLCEFGLPIGGIPSTASKRTQVTGAIILGVIEGLEERIAELDRQISQAIPFAEAICQVGPSSLVRAAQDWLNCNATQEDNLGETRGTDCQHAWHTNPAFTVCPECGEGTDG